METHGFYWRRLSHYMYSGSFIERLSRKLIIADCQIISVAKSNHRIYWGLPNDKKNETKGTMLMNQTVKWIVFKSSCRCTFLFASWRLREREKKNSNFSQHHFFPIIFEFFPEFIPHSCVGVEFLFSDEFHVCLFPLHPVRLATQFVFFPSKRRFSSELAILAFFFLSISLPYFDIRF